MIIEEINNSNQVNPFTDDLDYASAKEYNDSLINEYKSQTKAFKKQTLEYFLKAKAEIIEPELALFINDFIAIMALKSTEVRRDGYIINNGDNLLEKYHNEMIKTCNESRKTLKDVLSFLDVKIKSLRPQPTAKPSKLIFKTFDDVLINEDLKIKMYQILKNYKVHNTSIFKPKTDLQVKNGKTAELYSVIKLLKEEGYFNKIPATKLHPLINERFKANATYQHYKQTVTCINKLE